MGGQETTAAVKRQLRRSKRKDGGQKEKAAVKRQLRRSKDNCGGQLSDLHKCQVSLLASERRRSSACHSSRDKYSNRFATCRAWATSESDPMLMSRYRRNSREPRFAEPSAMLAP